jgi:copper chaperone
MNRALVIAAALMFSAPAFACPYEDAAAYQTAAAQVDEADGTKVVLNVEGMTCGSCSTKLSKTMVEVDGVTAAAFDYQTGEAKIAFVEGKVDVDALIKAIEDAGYTAKVATAA